MEEEEGEEGKESEMLPQHATCFPHVLYPLHPTDLL